MKQYTQKQFKTIKQDYVNAIFRYTDIFYIPDNHFRMIHDQKLKQSRNPITKETLGSRTLNELYVLLVQLQEQHKKILPNLQTEEP